MKKQRKKLLVGTLVLQLFFSTTLLGGDWVSGGGLILQNEYNPWFLKNTPFIKTCIKVDREKFEVDDYDLLRIIKMAFMYWQGEFDSYRVLQKKITTKKEFPISKEIQTERFVTKLECRGDEDLVFQMGFLTKVQQEKLQKSIDISKAYGLSVRTQYDQEKMRGKGFIYIAAEKGAGRPHSKKNPELLWVKNQWLLLRLLIHEIGHVYGFSHLNTSRGTIMSEDFMDKAIDDALMRNYSPRKHHGPFLGFNKRYKLNMSSSEKLSQFLKFFGQNKKNRNHIKSDFVLEVLSFTENEIRLSFSFYNAYQSANEEKLGILGTFTSKEKPLVDKNELSTIWIPLEQKYKKSWKVKSGKHLPSTYTYELTYSGNVQVKGNKKDMTSFLTITPNKLRLGLLIENKIEVFRFY